MDSNSQSPATTSQGLDIGPGLETNAKQGANSHSRGECGLVSSLGTGRGSSLAGASADRVGRVLISKMRETIERRRVYPKAEDRP